MDIITEILNNEKYKLLCRKISNNSSQWQDLYQEFCLIVLDEKNKAKWEDVRNLDVYVYSTILYLWRGRYRIKNSSVSNTSSLYLVADNLNQWDNYNEEIAVRTRSYSETVIIAELRIRLKQLLKSDNKKTQKQAELLNLYCNGLNRL